MRKIAMLLVLTALVLLFGCKSKHKVVEKQAFSVERVEAITVSELTEMDIKTETITTNNDESIDIETADPDKEVTVTKEEKDGKTTWTATNVKNLSVSKNDNTTTEKTEDNTVIDTETRAETELEIDFSETNRNVKIKGNSFWLNVAIPLLLIAILIYVIWRLYKKYRNKLPF